MKQKFWKRCAVFALIVAVITLCAHRKVKEEDGE